MPAAAIAVIIKIIDSLLQAGQMKKEEADAARTALAQMEIQKSQTFAQFIASTSNIIYTLVRNAIVVTIMVGFLYKPLEDTLMDAINRLSQAGFTGLLFLSIVLWEFYGREALTIFGAKNGNGGGNGDAPPPPAPPVSGQWVTDDSGRHWVAGDHA